MNAMFYVYLICRLDGRPCYVGKGKGDRWKHHERYNRRGNRLLAAIIDAAQSTGKELPKIKLAENLTETEAFAAERAWIAKLGRKAHGGPLVNMTDGGEGPSGCQATLETRRKISAAKKGWKPSAKHLAHLAKLAAQGPHRGRFHSDQAKEKIRAARTRQPRQVSPATQFQKAGVPWNKGLAGYNPSPATQFKPGYQPTEATRAKLSESVKASWDRRKAASQELSLT